jgi:hypothetical protein
MATESDKTNNGVVLTAFLVGAAAMAGGSAGLVALAKGEIQSVSEEQSGYADLATVKQLKSQQRKALRGGKLPIDKAQATVLKAIQSNPRMASPEALAAATGGAAAGATAVGSGLEASAGAGGTEPQGTEESPSPTTNPSEAPTSAPQDTPQAPESPKLPAAPSANAASSAPAPEEAAPPSSPKSPSPASHASSAPTATHH